MLLSNALFQSKNELNVDYRRTQGPIEQYDRVSFAGSFVGDHNYIDNVTAFDDISDTFVKFHEQWKACGDDPLVMAEQFCNLSNEFLERLPKLQSRASLTKGVKGEPTIKDAFQLEFYAWQLIGTLYSSRLEHENNSMEPRSLKPQCHSEKEIVNFLYESDNELKETQIVIDWLEGRVRDEILKVAEKYECLFNETTVWENTRHMLEMLGNSELKARNLITELFPDAPYATDGKLASADVADNDRYLHYLFLCIRAGDLQRAQRLCLQRGECWRAAAMEGWRPFHCIHFSQSDQLNSEHEMTPTEGNSNRILSKSVSWWNAENPVITPHERSIYAAQSGNLSALLKGLSGSWDDLLWAHCRALVESRVDASLRTLLHCGPRANTISVFGRPCKSWSNEAGLAVPDAAWVPGSWSLADAFLKAELVMDWSPSEYIRKSANNAQADTSFLLPTLKPCEMSIFLNGTTAANSNSQKMSKALLIQSIFYTICRGVALKEYSELLATLVSCVMLLVPPSFQEVLRTGAVNTCNAAALANLANAAESSSLEPLNSQLLRFLAHVVICLRHFEPNLPDNYCTSILEAYMVSLIVERRFSLIAEYTACLSSVALQTRWYASFLAGLKKKEDREQCLVYGSAAGLNLQSITRAVVRIARQRFAELDQKQNVGLDASFLDPSSADTVHHPLSEDLLAGMVGRDVVGLLTPTDKFRIAVIDWLVYNKSQKGEALVLANSLLRLFIAMRKLKAARSVVQQLPMAILDQVKAKLAEAEEDSSMQPPSWLINTVREHECLLLYLQALEVYSSWYEHFHSSCPIAPNTGASGASTYLADRVASEGAERNYQARLDCWRHEVDLSTSSLVYQLKSLLTYEFPGWLVDTAIMLPQNNNLQLNGNPAAPLDVTGMFGEGEEDSDEYGIAGLGESPEARQLQMTVVREMCIREVVLLLVEVYKSTGRHYDCVRLADLVSDSEYGLFKVFSKRQMQQLLRLIQESMRELQASCGDALGYGSDSI